MTVKAESTTGDPGRPLRFGLVGGAATLTHIVAAGMLLLAAPQASPYLVTVAAFCVAFSVSFFGHRYLTFRRPGSVPRFLVVSLAGLALNNLLVGLLLAASASAFLAILIATAAVPVLVYFASLFWVFQPPGG